MKSRILLIFVLFSHIIYSQTVIKGKVINAMSRIAVESANINVAEEETGMLKTYTTTDEQGNYEINYAGNKDSIFIRVSGFNLKNTSKKIANRNQTLNFEVEQANIELREVIVKAQKIRQTGDTLNYLVSEFKNSTDRTIGDVIKKLPGIQVADDGTVYYQNIPINKYYIENLDLLQGRYGIANSNIKAEDISTVQIMENHQPVKALKDIQFSNQAALNLKLKDSAKGIIVGTGQAGIGLYPLLLNNELIGMYFSPTIQNITMYKNDNTGRDITKELNSLYSVRAEQLNSKKLLEIQSPALSAIRQQRYLFNNAHTGSLNNLYKLNDKYLFSTNINYLYDEPQRESVSLSEYFLPDSLIIRVNEKLKSQQTQNKLNTDFLINANTPDFYFNNALKMEGDWMKESGDVQLPDEHVSQKLYAPVYTISNTFDLIKKKNKRYFELHSFSGYKKITQSLTITPVLYEDLFNTDTKDGNLLQDLSLNNFTTRNSLKFGIGKFNIDFNFNAELKNMQTGLYAQTKFSATSADSLQNRLNRNLYEWGLKNFYSFDLTSTMNIILIVPVRYVLLHRNNYLQNEKTNTGYFFVEPYINFNYQITPSWALSLNYIYSNDLGDIQDTYTGYMMTSYRNLMKNDENLYRQNNQNTIFHIEYKNPFTTLFAAMTFSYTHTKANLLDDYVFRNVLKIKSSLIREHSKNHFLASFQMGKNIETIASKVSMNTNYSRLTSPLINQGVISDYVLNSISIYPKFTTEFSSIAVLDYQIKYGINKSNLTQSVTSAKLDLPVIHTFTQNAKFSLLPMRNLLFAFSIEQFYNRSITVKNHPLWFGDIGIKYVRNSIEFMVDYTNIFNSSQYVMSSYSDIARYYYSYQLRPAEILFRIRFNLK